MKARNLTLKETFVVCIALTVVAVCAGIVGYKLGIGDVSFAQATQRSLDKSDLLTAYTTITTSYDGKFDKEHLLESGIKGMTASLGSKYSYFMTREEYQKILTENTGKYYGFGFVYSFRTKQLTIDEVFPDSPAAKSGVSPKSHILSINNISVETFQTLDSVAKIFAATDRITLVASLPDRTKKTFTITKARFTAPDLTYETISPTYGYLKIYQFSSNIQKEFPTILAKIKKDMPQKLIIDLRDNPGGENESEIFLADQFIKIGVLSEETYKVQRLNKKFSATGNAPLADIPLILLVNSQTASAAETFTAAVHDNSRGIIVGEKTFGKGTIGQYYELPNGAAMKLTIGKWLTPNGEWIQGKGISPDYAVPDDFPMGIDTILQKAESL